MCFTLISVRYRMFNVLYIRSVLTIGNYRCDPIHDEDMLWSVQKWPLHHVMEAGKQIEEAQCHCKNVNECNLWYNTTDTYCFVSSTTFFFFFNMQLSFSKKKSHDHRYYNLLNTFWSLKVQCTVFWFAAYVLNDHS